jgi:hypothetical protein
VLVCRIAKEHRRLTAGPAVFLGDKAVHLVSELNCESIVPKARDRTVDLALIKGVDYSSEFHGPIMPYVLVTQGKATSDLGPRRDRRHGRQRNRVTPWAYSQTEGAGGLTWLRADEMVPLTATWNEAGLDPTVL